MSLPIFTVDAFADRPFVGNPAAVCLLDGPAQTEWMAVVASEMNLSETAFLYPEGEGYRLRWFTPSVEVDLCGHATLASAHILWETGRLGTDTEARFQTRSGLLMAQRRGELIEMNFPACQPEPCSPPADLLKAVDVAAEYVGFNGSDYLVATTDERAVREAEPDLAMLAQVEARGIILTAAGSGGVDFVSRFFAPRAGVAEDPVTGSAHCALAPFWADRLGKTEMVGYQASRRGGYVRVRPIGDRVILGGRAVTVCRGELLPLPTTDGDVRT